MKNPELEIQNPKQIQNANPKLKNFVCNLAFEA